MSMKNLLLLFAFVGAFASASFAQTWGCPEDDLKCQLEGRMKALQADPKNPENYYNLGLVMQRGGDHPEAVEAFTMYVSIPGVKPELLADGYNARGISQRAMGKPELAHADYSKAIELSPKNASLYTNRANASRDMRKVPEMLEDYQRSIDVDPKFALAYANRGHYYVATGKYDQALTDLTKAIELDAANPEPFYTRALTYRAKQEYAKAIPDLDKYISLKTGNNRYLADGYLNRGIAFALTGNPTQAEKDLSKAIELAPDHAEAYRTRAMFYREQKKPELAAADEQRYTDLKSGRPLAAPAKTSAATSLELVAEGSKYYMAGDYKRAIGPYRQALELEKKERELERKFWIVLVDNLGMAYGITGDIQASQEVLQYGISQEPTYPLFYYNMACGYGELADEENALKYLRLAFKHKANMIAGEKLPDPMNDSSFAKFRDRESFKRAVGEMSKGK